MPSLHFTVEPKISVPLPGKPALCGGAGQRPLSFASGKACADIAEAGGGAEGSVFDAFEDLDAQECLKKAVEIERVDAFGE